MTKSHSAGAVVLAIASLVVAGLAGGPAPASPAQGAWSPLPWTAPVRVTAPGDWLDDVSCPTTTWCMAVGAVSGHGTVASEDTTGLAAVWAGSAWSQPEEIDPYDALSSVSCPTTTWCMAVDGMGYALVWDSTQWSQPELVGAAIDRGGNSVSCPTTTWCMALNTMTDQTWVYTDGSWRTAGVPLPPPWPVGGGGWFKDVSCPTATWCMIVGGKSAVWRAGAWTVASTPGGDLQDVSCPRAGWCAVVGNSESGPPGYVFLPNGHGGWQRTVFPGFDAWGVSCPTTTFCVVTGSERAVFWNGSAWSQPELADGERALITGVSCPTTSFCAAVDGSGYAMEWR